MGTSPAPGEGASHPARNCPSRWATPETAPIASPWNLLRPGKRDRCRNWCVPEIFAGCGPELVFHGPWQVVCLMERFPEGPQMAPGPPISIPKATKGVPRAAPMKEIPIYKSVNENRPDRSTSEHSYGVQSSRLTGAQVPVHGLQVVDLERASDRLRSALSISKSSRRILATFGNLPTCLFQLGLLPNPVLQIVRNDCAKSSTSRRGMTGMRGGECSKLMVEGEGSSNPGFSGISIDPYSCRKQILRVG